MKFVYNTQIRKLNNMSTRWEIQQYVPLIEKIMTKGEARDTRAGKAFSIFGETLEIDTKEFPILKGRKMYYKSVLGELAAMLKGAETVQEFQDLGCNYWDEFADKEGKLVLDYGTAWLDFNGVNQLKILVDTLKTNPNDRRMIISGWRPDRLKELSLPCCHLLYQWYVREGKYLDMIWYQRSVDVMIGLPSDIIFAAVWNMLLANTCGYESGTIKFILGDTHIYGNHYFEARRYIEQAEDLFYNFASTIKPVTAKLDGSVFDFHPSMFSLTNYVSRQPIKFKLNV